MEAIKNGRLKYLAKELEGLRKVVSYLWDGNQEAFNAIYFLKANYKEWSNMLRWLRENQIYGQKLADFFKNESPDGGGYHLGATLILSRLKGHKFQEVTIKAGELL
jgi:hypothetical protein